MILTVITPVGPGHEEVAERRAIPSVGRMDSGPFSSIVHNVIDDTKGKLGRGAARNQGMDFVADWYFFLDADDEIEVDAIRHLAFRYAATFGAIKRNGKISRLNRHTVCRNDLYTFGAAGTLTMGFFINPEVARSIRFNEEMNIAEDFDFYMRLPNFAKVPFPLVNICSSECSAGGPKGYENRTVNWYEECRKVIQKYTSPKLELTKEGNFNSPDDPGEPYSRAKRRSVTLDEAKILSELSRDKVVLEIGTGLGVSTREMAMYSKVVYSVDIDPWAHQFKFPNNVILCTEVPRGIKFDLAFIDGSHLYHHIMDDIEKVDADLIVIHDCYLPNVGRAVKNSGLKEVKVYGTRCDMRSFTK